MDQQHDDKALLHALERGSEPFWMQDIRLALKRLESARRALHDGAADVADPAPDQVE